MSKCSQALRRRDEALEEQRADDRAGHAAACDVVEVGGLGIRASSRRARHSGIRHSGSFSAAACCAELGRKRVVVGVERRQLRPERDARRAGERRHVDQQVGRLLVGERQRVGQDQAAFGIGVADLDREALARADRRRAGGTRRRRPNSPPPGSARAAKRQPRSMIMCASASTLAAPPMSFFMISMPLSGLSRARRCRSTRPCRPA